MTRFLLLALLLLATPTIAQNADRAADAAARSPDLPIVLVVPFPEGGSAGRVSEVVSAALSSAMNRSIGLRHVTTGTGVDALNQVIALAPEEIQLGYATNTQIVPGFLLSGTGAAFNPIEDFDWIGVIGTFGIAVVVGPRDAGKTFDQWLADLPRRGRTIRLGAGATGSMSRLAAQFLAQKLALPVDIVVGSSADAGYGALARGEIDAYFDGLPNALEETPRLKGQILAVTSKDRAPSFPTIPSFGERWKDEDYAQFAGLVVSRKETEAIRARLKSGWYGVNRAGTAKVELEKLGMKYLGLDLETAQSFMEAEFLRHAKLLGRFSRSP
jgi:tripartite-type tricarboxylate transporter receptor subunit TctC